MAKAVTVALCLGAQAIAQSTATLDPVVTPIIIVTPNIVGNVDCIHKLNGWTYDFSDLYQPQGVQHVDADGTTYNFAVCGQATDNSECLDGPPGWAACIEKDITNNGERLRTTYGQVSQSSWAKNSLTLNYAGPKTQRVGIMFECGPEQNLEGKITEVLRVDDQVSAILRTPCACPNDPNVPEQCRPFRDTAGIKPISFGSVNIIIFFVIMSLYFVGGFLYMKLVKGRTGGEAVPHVEFWSDLPDLVIDGTRWLRYKVGGSGSGSGSSNAGSAPAKPSGGYDTF